MRYSILLLLVMAISIACSSSSNTSSRLANSVEVWLEAPTEAKIGEPIVITLNVKNTTSRPLELFIGGDVLIFRIVDANGSAVWRSPQVIENWRAQRALQPGQVNFQDGELSDIVSHTVEWNQADLDGNQAQPGDYFLHGAFLAGLTEDSRDWETLEADPHELTINP